MSRGLMTTRGPRSQNPWQPVARMSTWPSSFCFASSSWQAAGTAVQPWAWQPVPLQTVMTARFGSLLVIIDFFRASSSPGDFSFATGDILYSLVIFLQHGSDTLRRHLAV